MREFLSTLPDVISTKAGPRLSAQSAEQVSIARRLFEAVRDHRAIEMSYFSVASQRIRPTRAEPYRLTPAQGGPYPLAWLDAIDAFPNFATNRLPKRPVAD